MDLLNNVKALESPIAQLLSKDILTTASPCDNTTETTPESDYPVSSELSYTAGIL